MQNYAAALADHPHLVEVVGGYVAEAGYDYESEFLFGLDVILDRLEQLLDEALTCVPGHDSDRFITIMIPQASQLTRTGRIGVLLICSMSLFIVGLDITAVNVALPVDRRADWTRASPGCSGRSAPTPS